MITRRFFAFLVLVNKFIIYDEDIIARSSYYKSVNGRKWNNLICGKLYGTLADKGKQRVPDEKKRSRRDTHTSVRCFKCGEYEHHAPDCKSTTMNYFKCGKSGHRDANCRNYNLTSFNCRERCHISNQCEKLKKDHFRGNVFGLSRVETTTSDNLIQGT